MPTSLLDLKGAQDPGRALEPLTEQEVQFEGEVSDLAALKIVTQDVQKAEAYLNSKRMPIDWNDYDDLYRAFVKSRPWPGTDVNRSNLGMPIIMETIEDVLPQIHMAFFSDKQPFLLEPVGKTEPDAARAASKILCWAIKESGFKEEIRLHLKSCLLPGFGVSKYGWELREKTWTEYKRKQPEPTVNTGLQDVSVPTEQSDQVEKIPHSMQVPVPTFENYELRYVLMDPSLRRQDCRKGKWICFQKFTDAEELDDLAEDPSYKNVPTREELVALMVNRSAQTPDSLAASKIDSYREMQAEKPLVEPSADPLKQPLELLEYWTDDRVVTVLNRVVVIRNEGNEFGEIPAFSNAFIDVIGSAYGFGIGFLLRGEQRFQQGVLNTWIDNLALILNRPHQRIGAINGGSQNLKLSPGKITNEPTELKPLDIPDVSGVALEAIGSSEARASRRIGLDSTQIPKQAYRTGSGVQSLQAAVAGKLQYFIEIFSDLVYIPALEAFLKMCKDRLTPSQMNAILTEEEGKAYKGDIMDVYNGNYRFDVLASTKLAARKAIAQLIPLWVQLFSAAPVQESLTQQNKKVDYVEMIEMMIELSGASGYEIITDMTPEDQQRVQQEQQAAQQAAQQQMVQGKQIDQQNKLDQIQAKGDVLVGNTLVKSLLKNSENASALESKIGNLESPNEAA